MIAALRLQECKAGGHAIAHVYKGSLRPRLLGYVILKSAKLDQLKEALKSQATFERHSCTSPGQHPCLWSHPYSHKNRLEVCNVLVNVAV